MEYGNLGPLCHPPPIWKVGVENGKVWDFQKVSNVKTEVQNIWGCTVCAIICAISCGIIHSRTASESVTELYISVCYDGYFPHTCYFCWFSYSKTCLTLNVGLNPQPLSRKSTTHVSEPTGLAVSKDSTTINLKMSS